MNAVAARAAVLKQLKAGGAKARKGSLRLAVGDLFWYVDPRIVGVGERAQILLEVGCWTSALPPEPDGGAVDCPLLFERIATAPAEDTAQVVGLVSTIGDLTTLAARLGEFEGALVDRSLRDLLDGV